MAERSNTSSRGLIVGLSVAVVLVVLLFVVRSVFREKVEVRTASVAYAPLISVVSTNGKVEPLKDFQAHAAAAGVVQKVYVAVNDHVQRGQLLLKMDENDARSKLASAQAALDAAARDLKNMQGGGTQDELLSQGNELNFLTASCSEITFSSRTYFPSNLAKFPYVRGCAEDFRKTPSVV